MAELKYIKEIIETQSLMPRRQQGKLWQRAQTRHMNRQQEVRNNCTEASYHEVINLVKKLYMHPNEVYFEKDSKHDKSDFIAMHSFITESFYWTLDCMPYYDLEVNYAFDNCPYEAAIRKMLRAFPLDRQAKPKELKPDFKTFYETVLTVQPETFIHSFKR